MRFTTRPELLCTFGAAASTHWLASQAAMRMLELGGNAFDAAAAGGMVLQVAEPHLNGPGGDAPILIHDAKAGETRVICGQGPIPKAASIEKFEALGLQVIPGSGLLPAVVPGAFDAWMVMLRDYGTMTFADIMEPAIHYAERGVPIVPKIRDTIAATRKLFTEHWKASAKLWLPNGQLPDENAFLANPALAETWKRLVKEASAAGGDRIAQIDAARSAWYEGFIAEEIDRFCRGEPHFDVTGMHNRGFLTGDDMAGWRATYEAPATYDYHGLTVAKCGPWSQGPVLLQCLALLKDIDIASMAPEGPEFVHTVLEVMKLAFADRDTFYCDPDAGETPLDHLLSDEYNARRRTLIGEKASLEYRPGEIPGYGYPLDYEAAVARIPAEGTDDGYGGGEPTADKPKLRSSGDTCHLDVVDRHGNFVSVTPSGGWLQSSPLIPSLGFCLGTRAQMMWLDPKSPSALKPGTRPRTTLTPSFALRDGKPYMAFGTPGGDKQDQWQLIFLLHHLHHGMNLQEAIDSPSFHSEHFPESFYPRHAHPGRVVIESRFSKECLDDLAKRGHEIIENSPWSEGRVSAVARDPDGIMRAAANPRGMQGYAVGR